MDYSLPESSVHGIFQARILGWVAISFTRGSSWPRDRTWVSCISCIAGRFFTTEPSGSIPPQQREKEIRTDSSDVSLQRVVCELRLLKPQCFPRPPIQRWTSSFPVCELPLSYQVLFWPKVSGIGLFRPMDVNWNADILQKTAAAIWLWGSIANYSTGLRISAISWASW